jgi:phosphatidate cytidylyltransferase
MTGLAARAAVAAVFIPLLIVVVRAGGTALLVLVEVAALVGLAEFYRVADRSGMRPSKVFGLGTTAVLIPLFGRGAADESVCILLLAVAIVLVARLPRGSGTYSGGASVTLFGVVYVGLALGHLLRLRLLGSVGWQAALLPFLLTWSCDTGAYFVGSAWGRHRLAPSVSPRKSWEGAIAGLAASVGAAFLGRAVFASFLSVRSCVELGALVGLVAQLGDLAESRMKREAGLDDASGLIPGHGGVLDRLDSLLFAIPTTYYYLLLRGIL